MRAQSSLIIFLLPMLSWAQTQQPASFNPAFFAGLVNNEINERSTTPDTKEAFNETRFTNVTVRAPVQSEVSGLTALERAAVALKTDIKDAEAGLQVAPFIGSGEAWSGLNLSLAVLEENVTQVGLGWAKVVAESNQPGLSDLKGNGNQPLSCQWDLTALNQGLWGVSKAYEEACAVSRALPTPPLDEAQKKAYEYKLDMARAACTGDGGDIPASPTFSWGKAQLDTFFSHYLELLDDAAPALRVQAGELLGRGMYAINAIRSFEFGPYEKCPDAEEIKLAMEQWRRREFSMRLGLGVQSQFFPYVGGFDPECEGKEQEPDCEKDKLTFKQVQPRAEVSANLWGVNVTLGLGLAFARETRGEDLTPSLAMALATDWPVTSPASQDVPRVVLGLEASARLALDKPAVQKELVSEGQVTAYVAVEVTDELSFRLGVPVKAELATREADEANQIPELRSLQWSVPAFVATVLKLD